MPGDVARGNEEPEDCCGGGEALIAAIAAEEPAVQLQTFPRRDLKDGEAEVILESALAKFAVDLSKDELVGESLAKKIAKKAFVSKQNKKDVLEAIKQTGMREIPPNTDLRCVESSLLIGSATRIRESGAWNAYKDGGGTPQSLQGKLFACLKSETCTEIGAESNSAPEPKRQKTSSRPQRACAQKAEPVKYDPVGDAETRSLYLCWRHHDPSPTPYLPLGYAESPQGAGRRLLLARRVQRNQTVDSLDDEKYLLYVVPDDVVSDPARLPKDRPWTLKIDPASGCEKVTDDQIKSALMLANGTRIYPEETPHVRRVECRGGPELIIHPVFHPETKKFENRTPPHSGLHCGLFLSNGYQVETDGSLIGVFGVRGDFSDPKDAKCWAYLMESPEEEGDAIDLFHTPFGYANHAARGTPECNVKLCHTTHTAKALRDIKGGEQLMWDYGKGALDDVVVYTGRLNDHAARLKGHLSEPPESQRRKLSQKEKRREREQREARDLVAAAASQ